MGCVVAVEIGVAMEIGVPMGLGLWVLDSCLQVLLEVAGFFWVSMGVGGL